MWVNSDMSSLMCRSHNDLRLARDVSVVGTQ